MIPILTSSVLAISPTNINFQESPPHQESLFLASDDHFDGENNLDQDNNPSNNIFETHHSDVEAESTVRLITSTRHGHQLTIDFETDSDHFSITQGENTTIPIDELENVVEILADEQEYLDQNRVINARGNVVIRFANGVLTADQVSVNLDSRIAVAQGNVALERGEQILKGERFEYFFVQNEGTIINASGTVFQPTLEDDFQIGDNRAVIPRTPLGGQIRANQPLQDVRSAQSLNLILGSTDDLTTVEGRFGDRFNEAGGRITQLRFEAETVEFDGRNWIAKDIRITNDPFSPPELEIRADSASLTNVSPFRDELNTSNSRVVFDQKVSVPIFFNQFVFTPRRRRPFTFSVGYDGGDLGGLFVERDFNIYDQNDIVFSITPQFLIQRALLPDSVPDNNIDNPEDNGGLLNPSSFGLVIKLDASFSDRTELISTTNLTGLDLGNFADRVRANILLNHRAGNLNNPHLVSGKFATRERFFNGSLGFQTVEQIFGASVTSPTIPLGNSRFNFVYQGAIENITANTDRPEFVSMDKPIDTVNLTRYQGVAQINGAFPLWEGEPLPPTPTEGLRYSPTPVVPFFGVTGGVTAIGNYYSNDETQGSLTGSVGIQGQIGTFSKKYLDYTAYNLSYSQGFANENSPFLFDRFVDTKVLSLGVIQQFYGPVRGGFQTYINLDNGNTISTDYIVEYSRRAYGVVLRYNPILEIGSINLRISNFNWRGDTEPFDPE